MNTLHCSKGGGPRVVISTAAFHARVRGSVPGLGGLKETKLFLPHPRVKVSNVGSLRDREVACSALDRQGSNFESCVWRTVSSQSSHHPQEVLLAQFSLYVHKGGLKPDSFHFFPLQQSLEPRTKTFLLEHTLRFKSAHLFSMLIEHARASAAFRYGGYRGGGGREIKFRKIWGFRGWAPGDPQILLKICSSRGRGGQDPSDPPPVQAPGM